MASSNKAWNPGARRERLILLTVLNHPNLLERHLEDFSALSLADPELDRLRAIIIELASATPDLETGGLRGHLMEQGFGGVLDKLQAAGAGAGEFFCAADAAFVDAETGWLQTIWRHHRENVLRQAIQGAELALAADFSEEKWQELMILQQQLAEDGPEALVTGFGEASGRALKR